MKIEAAVVHSFDHPPRYDAFDLPDPAGRDQALVDVLAVGLHPRVRSAAAGRHYTSTGELPMIPGVAGVGRRVGYDSPSQFSREYRRQFGAPPGQDAARLRELPPAPAFV